MLSFISRSNETTKIKVAIRIRPHSNLVSDKELIVDTENSQVIFF
jgi:hypothetical protein